MVSLSAQEGNLSVWEDLCCSERALLRSMVEVGRLSAQAGNLSVWEGLYSSDRAPYQSVQALEWTHDVIPSVWESLILH